MKGEWCYYKNRFTAVQCANIIDVIKTRPSQDGALGVNGEKDNTFRRSQIRFVPSNDPEFSFVFDELWKMAIQANDRYFGFHLSKLDYLQVAEYQSTNHDEYRRHHDVFYINSTEYHRKLSVVIQLSDPSDYEGGALELYDIQEQPPVIDFKGIGTTIFFPSFTQHAALPVTRGTRYSIAAWIEGPKWV
jgi:PKHD-type hydroxylase